MDLGIIRKHEGLRLVAYPDPGTGGEPWTIGYGNTFYENGTKVKKGDTITRDRADRLLFFVANQMLSRIRPLITSKVNDNQISALLSFTYNVGVDAFRRSTLLRKVNANPGDPSIRQEFEKWNKAAGRILPGLIIRRKEEADLYFKP